MYIILIVWVGKQYGLESILVTYFERENTIEKLPANFKKIQECHASQFSLYTWMYFYVKIKDLAIQSSNQNTHIMDC